jgi:hypothetical protein
MVGDAPITEYGVLEEARPDGAPAQRPLAPTAVAGRDAMKA